MPTENNVTYAVKDKLSQEIVYTSSTKGHAEIYINTCFEPWKFEIIELDEWKPEN